ncbi:MAG: hypothetical protein RL033_2654, partial [Pseudomonadota bacterium]
AKAPPSGEVAAFLEQYGIHQRLGRPRERVLTWLARVSQGLGGFTDPSALADAALRQDLRGTIFKLEGILKLYRRGYERALEAPYQAAKSLEDALGAWGAGQHLVELARQAAAPAPVLVWSETQAELARAEVVEQLSKQWLPLPDGTVPILRTISDTLVALDFEGYAKDRRSLIRSIRRWLGKVADTSLDMYVLQGNHGLHELRRQLRWLPIFAVSLDGLVITSDEHNPVKEYRALTSSAVAQSPYARLPEPTREDSPIAISRSLFLAVTDLIAQLGEIKDLAEDVQALEHALLGGGVAKTSRDARQQALSLLGRTREQELESQLRAERLYRGLRRNRLFKHLRCEFKD